MINPRQNTNIIGIFSEKPILEVQIRRQLDQNPLLSLRNADLGQ